MNDTGKSALIRTAGLCKSYPQTKTQALLDVNIEIAAGEFVSIKGPSGSGKSTLLNIIAGLIAPTAGDVYFRGSALSGMANKSLYRRRHIGYIFQDYYLYPRFTVLENVLLPMAHSFFIKGKSVQKARDLLGYLNMDGKADRSVNVLSAGERQRVCIARALLNEPELILADEPTGSLDSRNAGIILDILKEINRSKRTTIIMVTHDEKVACCYHRTIEIIDGQVIKD